MKTIFYFAYFAWLKQVKLSPYFAYFALFIVGKISLYFALLCPSNDEENAKTNSTDLSLLCLLCPYFAYFVPTLPTMHFTHTPHEHVFSFDSLEKICSHKCRILLPFLLYEPKF